MNNEIWKDIEGFENYQVSSLGNVRNKTTQRILKYSDSGNGYQKVYLSKDGIKYSKKIHRLVAEAFIPNPQNKSDVDHINTNRYDNNISNLRWATRKENCNNPLSIKHYQVAKQNWLNK